MSHQFYLTLPSDSSSKYYPENTTAYFKTKLSERISLDGEYKVGLAQFIYPRSWFNFINYDDTISIHFIESGHETEKTTHIFNSGQFGNEQKLLENINNEINVSGLSFIWNPVKRKVSLKITYAHAPLFMSEAFKTLFGFDTVGPYTKGSHMAAHTFDLNGNIHFLYVYSDIVSYSVVGDTKVPLLRVCDTEGEYGHMVKAIFTHPYYVPIDRNDFDTIEININTELGNPVPFEFGKSVVTLHFRRKHKLLL
jgi:hypothetical protein